MREIHQWIRSAIRDSQQPSSPIGFLFLKLPPPPCAVLLVHFYEFTFYGFTASSSSRSSTLIHYAFTHLPSYRSTVFSCSRCPRKSINLPLYGFTLVSFASTPPLRFYAFTALLPLTAHALHTEHESRTEAAREASQRLQMCTLCCTRSHSFASFSTFGR